MVIKENCSVIGVYQYIEKRKLLGYLREGLSALQHRGQDAVGISLFSAGIKTSKTMGLLSESTIFLENIEGRFGIGHNRYSTTGKNLMENVQPTEMVSKYGVNYSFAFNGNLKNYLKLRAELSDKLTLSTDSDSEIMAFLFGNELGKKDIVDIYRESAPKIDGSYSIVMLVGGKKPRVIAIRDPLGFRPLCIGENKDGYFIASESVAFADSYMDAKFLRDIEPGEIVIFDDDGFHSFRVFNFNRHAHCMFEWVYFSRPDSIIEGISVYNVRKKLGEYLAKDAYVESDCVIPVPDSGRGAAIGFSWNSKTPLGEAFQLDRYQYRRIFILPGNMARAKKATKKLNVVFPAINGKKLVVVDDSIVRGTNMRNMCINKLKEAGAKEIHVRISCPPIMDRCPFGVDFHQGELIASQYVGRTHEEICVEVGNELGADSLYYNTIQNLIEAIGLPEKQLCFGCLTGKYPHIVWSRKN